MTGPPRRDHARTPGESHMLAGRRTGDYFVSLYDYIVCCTRCAGAPRGSGRRREERHV